MACRRTSRTFLNDRSLSAAEKEVIINWANGGAPKGDPKDMPSPPVYSDGWALGKPDAVFEMEEPYKLPADGTIQYQYFYLPTNFTEPKWVKSIEIRPSNRQVVHHVLVYYRATPDLQRTPVFRPNATLAKMPPEAKDGISLNKPRQGRRPAGSSRPTRRGRHTRSHPKAPRFGSSPAASSSCRCTTRPRVRRLRIEPRWG